MTLLMNTRRSDSPRMTGVARGGSVGGMVLLARIIQEGWGFGREARASVCQNTAGNRRFRRHGGPCMTDPTVPQRVLFPELGGKPVVATFDRDQASSDDGAVLLTAAERVYGLVQRFARCLVDKRAPERIRHTPGGPGRPAGLRHRARSSGRERCRPPRGRSHPQTAVGSGPGHRRAPGVATDAVAIRERGGPGRLVRDGPGVGRERHRTAPATPTGGGRGGSRSIWTRRTTRRTGRNSHLLQTVIRHVVLSAAAGVRDQVMEVALYHALGDPTGTSIHPTDSADEAVLEDRHGVCSTIVTSQLPVEKWHDVIGDPPLADAILDRLAHNAYRLELKGDSMRKRRRPSARREHSEP